MHRAVSCRVRYANKYTYGKTQPILMIIFIATMLDGIRAMRRTPVIGHRLFGFSSRNIVYMYIVNHFIFRIS